MEIPCRDGYDARQFLYRNKCSGNGLEVTDGSTTNFDVNKVILGTGLSITSSVGRTVTLQSSGGGGGGIGGSIGLRKLPMEQALILLEAKLPSLTRQEQTLYPLAWLLPQEQEFPSAEQVQLRPTMVQFLQVVH